MGHKQINRVLKQMKQVFSGEELRRPGMESGQCRRLRKVTLQRLALSLIQSLGEGKGGAGRPSAGVQPDAGSECPVQAVPQATTQGVVPLGLCVLVST